MNARARRRLSRERIEEIRAETFAEHEADAPVTMPAATIVRLCDELLDLVAPVPSGEVETPCATCGGTREVADYYSRQGAENGFSRPCPDCGVETPEAAVEAMARAFYEWDYGPGERGESRTWDEEDEGVRQWYRHGCTDALSALIAQGWTPPGTEDAK